VPHGLPRRELLLGFALVAVSALGYAWMPIFAKGAYRAGASPLDLLALRFTLALPLFWGAALTGRRAELAVGSRRILPFLLVGLIFGLASICMFYAYRYIEASLAVIILYTYPALIALWGRIFLGERLGTLRLASLGAAFLGVVLTAGTGSASLGGTAPRGIGLALAASLLFSCYSLLAQRALAGTSPLVFTTYTVSVTFLLLAALAPPLGVLLHAGWRVIGYAALLAVFSTFLSIYTYARGIRHIGAVRAGVVSNLEMVGVVILSYLFLGERLGLAQLAGGLLILGGVYLLQAERPESGPGGLPGRPSPRCGKSCD
jgi:drug/metabolite transporter (DMT)-like permease